MENLVIMFENVYKGKKVIITGNTGFKGSWLTLWLNKLGADLYGYSNGIITSPSMYEELGLSKIIKTEFSDINDIKSLEQFINKVKPDFIFHLAAQSLVFESFLNPTETIKTNLIGTMNLLEVLRSYNGECSTVLITSDKVYENIEQIWGYKETDQIGGKDIYSASKGASEIIINSYLKTFFLNKLNIKIAVGRAGNVIGGGDWSKNRIVVDCYRAWSEDKKVQIRNPNATRPWQHVLEPLSGYLLLGKELYFNLHNHSKFNFGPEQNQIKSVKSLINDLFEQIDSSTLQECYSYSPSNLKEANLLSLNCEKAFYELRWKPTLNYEQLISFTSQWYNGYYFSNNSLLDLSFQQITQFENFAKKNKAIWTT